jgi:hypothetical protein
MNLPQEMQDAIAKIHAGASFDELDHTEQQAAMTATSVHVVDNMFALLNQENGSATLAWARQLPEVERAHHAKEAWTAEMLGEPVQIGAMACLVVSQIAAGKYQLDAFNKRARN